MKIYFLISIVTLMCNYTKGQYQDINWCFADSIGLNFLTNPPEFFECSLTCYNEVSSTSISSISDESGNLLFYTNGNKVWNKEHNLMQNGSGLFGLWMTYDPAMFPIIIPKPNSENIYYLFHGNEPVYYSVIDMQYNDGLGKVIEKNKLLENPWSNNATYKLNAVKHGNGRDWWVVFPSTFNDWDDESYDLPTLYHRLLITPDGLIQMPTIEGEIFNEEDFGFLLGQSKFSPDGSLFGVTCGEKVWLYYFDRCSGELTHYYTIDSIWTGNPDDFVSGLEFSPDGSKLYITKLGGSLGVSRLYQYDLAAEDIKASQVMIHQNNSDYSYTQLQLAPNGKIYATMPPDDGETYDSGLPQTMYISIIHNPNEAGEACNYEHLGQYLGGKKVKFGLPNMPNYNLGVLPKSACDTLSTDITEVKAEDKIKLYPNPATEDISIANTHFTVFVITDITGRILESGINNNNQIDIEQLPSGYFILQCKNNEETVAYYSFIKN